MKPSIRFLSQLCGLNHRTSYCQNLNGIAENVNTDLKDLSCNKVKNMMKYCKVPEEDIWRTVLVQDLLELRWNSLEIEVIMNEIEDLDTLIEEVCLMCSSPLVRPYLSEVPSWTRHPSLILLLLYLLEYVINL